MSFKFGSILCERQNGLFLINEEKKVFHKNSRRLKRIGQYEFFWLKYVFIDWLKFISKLYFYNFTKWLYFLWKGHLCLVRGRERERERDNLHRVLDIITERIRSSLLRSCIENVIKSICPCQQLFAFFTTFFSPEGGFKPRSQDYESSFLPLCYLGKPSLYFLLVSFKCWSILCERQNF